MVADSGSGNRNTSDLLYWRKNFDKTYTFASREWVVSQGFLDQAAADNMFVRYDVTQNLSEAQIQRAKYNIGLWNYALTLAGATAVGDSAIAIGGSANASGTASVAIGLHAQATQSYTFAFGTEATATGDHGIAVGNAATASGAFSSAIGVWSVASGGYTVNYGQDGRVYAYGSVNLGILNDPVISTPETAYVIGSPKLTIGDGSYGTSTEERKNTLELYNDGSLWLQPRTSSERDDTNAQGYLSHKKDGTLIYNNDVHRFQWYDGTVWNTIDVSPDLSAYATQAWVMAQGYLSSLAGAVRYDDTQSLTSTQQLQAVTNIGVTNWIKSIDTVANAANFIDANVSTIYVKETRQVYDLKNNDLDPLHQIGSILRNDSKYWVGQLRGLKANNPILKLGSEPQVLTYNPLLTISQRASDNDTALIQIGQDITEGSISGNALIMYNVQGSESIWQNFHRSNITANILPIYIDFYVDRGTGRILTFKSNSFYLSSDTTSIRPPSATLAPPPAKSILENWTSRPGFGIYNGDWENDYMQLRGDGTLFVSGSIAKIYTEKTGSFTVPSPATLSDDDYRNDVNNRTCTYYFTGTNSSSNLCTLPDITTGWYFNSPPYRTFHDAMEYEFYNFGTVPLTFSQPIYIDNENTITSLDYTAPDNILKIKLVEGRWIATQYPANLSTLSSATSTISRVVKNGVIITDNEYYVKESDYTLLVSENVKNLMLPDPSQFTNRILKLIVKPHPLSELNLSLPIVDFISDTQINSISKGFYTIQSIDNKWYITNQKNELSIPY